MSAAGGLPADAPPPSGDLFRFVQFEFPWALGPEAGRYVIRDAGDDTALRVFVIALLEAPEMRLMPRSRRRPRKADPEPPPAAVPTTRATVIRGLPVGEDEAKAWIAEPSARVPEELAVVARVVHLHRVASADPGVREPALDLALVVRVGYGNGDEVAHGHWTAAVEPGEDKGAKGRREAVLRPQERLAALLGGRDAALACEELVLRARSDVDAGRLREAALQLAPALDAALSELQAWRDRRDLAERLHELREARPAVQAASQAALQGGLDDPTAAEVTRVLGRLEAALRARLADGIVQ